jgi:hypothetical protein
MEVHYITVPVLWPPTSGLNYFYKMAFFDATPEDNFKAEIIFVE